MSSEYWDARLRMAHRNDSCGSPPWQATLPTLGFNMAEKWDRANETSMGSCQEGPKTLTTEAFYVLLTILFIVALNIIGSSIYVYKSYFKVLPKKYIIQNGKDSKNSSDDKSEKKSKKLPKTSVGSVWRKKLRPFFDCFCFQTNAREILDISPNQGSMDCVDGIRAIFFVDVFIAHVSILYFQTMRNVDKNVYGLLRIPLAQVAPQAFFIIDGFILVSGFLTGYFFTDYFKKKNGKIPWVGYFSSRFLRLTPSYMVLLAFYATLLTYTSSSPVWPTYDTNPVCRETWIYNLLYINNFISNYDQCLMMSWFLACLMQLYMISPLFLVPLIRWPKTGLILTLSTICGACYAAFLVTYKHNLFGNIPTLGPPSQVRVEVFSRCWHILDNYHQNTFIRLTPYLVGILLGNYLQRRTLDKKNNWLTLSFGWIVSSCLMLVGLFALNNREETIWESAVYNGLKDLLFASGFSWIIFVCVTGQGGLMGKFLSNPIFKPIARLSFSGYLTQAILFEWYLLSNNVVFDNSIIYQGLFYNVTWTFMYGRLFLWTLISAFFVTAMIEYPVKKVLARYLLGK